MIFNGNLLWNNYIDLGSTAYSTGHFEIAETMLRQAAKEAHKLKRGYPAVAIVLENLAVVFFRQERYAKSERVFKRAIAMHESQRTEGRGAVDICRIHYKMAELFLLQDKLSLAERSLAEALDLAYALPERDKQMEITHLIRLATLWNERGMHDHAIKAYREVMVLRNQPTNAVQSFAP
ncbi:MAG TPA: tetratricopeptide repeat protein [Chroococcales cyanobacterium]